MSGAEEDARSLSEVVVLGSVRAQHIDGDALLGRATGAAAGDGLLCGTLLHSGDGVEMYDVDADDLLGPLCGARVEDDGGDDDGGDLPDDDVYRSQSSMSSSNSIDDMRSASGVEDGTAGSSQGGAVGGANDAGGSHADRGTQRPGTEANMAGSRPAHWPRAGPGRPVGTGLVMRESVKDVLVILFCRQAAAGLALRDGPSAAAERELDAQVEALDSLRKKYGAIKDEVLATKA